MINGKRGRGKAKREAKHDGISESYRVDGKYKQT